MDWATSSNWKCCLPPNDDKAGGEKEAEELFAKLAWRQATSCQLRMSTC